MKKIAFVVLCIHAFVLNAQKFEFDYILNSENVRENSKYNYTSFDMVNSNNHDLYMEVAGNTATKNFYSILLDYRGKLVYRFDVKKYVANPMKFTYKEHFAMRDQSFIKFKTIDIESLGNLKYRIFTSPTNKRSRNNIEISVLLAPFEDDLIIIDFEPLTKFQQNEVENLIKNQLAAENETGHFYIKEITYTYFNNSVLTKKITPEKTNLVLDL